MQFAKAAWTGQNGNMNTYCMDEMLWCVCGLHLTIDCIFVVYQAVVKAMELLALEGKIKEKTYGKQKIYFADQVSRISSETQYCYGKQAQKVTYAKAAV